MKREIEARFLNVDVVKCRESLLSLGFSPTSSRFLMKRQTFDFMDKVDGVKKWARVRQEARATTMTIKEVRSLDINGVFEAEVKIDDFARGVAFLLAANLRPGPFQENYREEWVNGDVYVTIDEWPNIPTFIEIEAADEERIMELARRMNLSLADAVYGSIDRLYEQYHGISEAEFNRIERLEFS